MKAFLKGKEVLIAIIVVIVAIAITVGIIVFSGKKEEPQSAPVTEEEEDSEGLQVEENADDGTGDSVDFSEFESEYKVDENGNVVDSTGKVYPNYKEDEKGNIIDSTTGEVIQPSNPGGSNSDSGNNSGSNTDAEFGPLF